MIGKKKRKERKEKENEQKPENRTKTKKVMGEFAATKKNLPAILLFFRLIDCLCAFEPYFHFPPNIELILARISVIFA